VAGVKKLRRPGECLAFLRLQSLERLGCNRKKTIVKIVHSSRAMMHAATEEAGAGLARF
jgi:hypothetical protein